MNYVVVGLASAVAGGVLVHLFESPVLSRLEKLLAAVHEDAAVIREALSKLKV